jgi:hypothetical protein
LYGFFLASAIASRLRCAKRLQARWIHGPQGAHRRGGTPLEDDVSGLHEEGAQVLVAELGDLGGRHDLPSLVRSPLGSLLRDEAEPGGEVASLFEAAAGTDRCHHGAGDNQANTRHGHQAVAGRVVLGEALNLADKTSRRSSRRRQSSSSSLIRRSKRGESASGYELS